MRVSILIFVVRNKGSFSYRECTFFKARISLTPRMRERDDAGMQGLLRKRTMRGEEIVLDLGDCTFEFSRIKLFKLLAEFLLNLSGDGRLSQKALERGLRMIVVFMYDATNSFLRDKLHHWLKEIGVKSEEAVEFVE